jgi:acyl-CoA synthetase (AMP-forming)/AMP-acid ligase II
VRTVGDLVARAAAQFPDRVAVRVRDGAEVTYGALDDRTDRLANALLGTGLRAGDRVAAWMADRIELVELYVAAAKAGLVVAPINARLAPPEAAYQLGDSGARMLVYSDDMAGSVDRIDAEALAGVQTVVVGTDELGASHRWERLVGDGAPGRPPAPDPDALFILGYTSGTTGRPKGAMLTHRSVLAIARLNASSFRLPPHATIALTGSMSFVAVVPAHVLCTLYLAGTVVIMGRWAADELLDVIKRDRVTLTYVPSPLLDDVTTALAADPAALTSLGSMLHSASKAAPEKLEALHAVIGGRLVEGWGMTENSGGLMTVTTAGDYLGARAGSTIFGSVGRSAIETAVRVVDGDQQPLPWDGETVGELCFSSPALMAGYWQQPDATREVLRDGWFRSGDLGAIDPDGYVRIAERRTDLIVSGGANVYPSEVERCISELPEVREVAVIGVPHVRWGQTVLAVVVPVAGAELTEADVVDHCRAQLAGFKKPSRVLFVDELPRTAGLKIARADLREQVLAQLAADPA